MEVLQFVAIPPTIGVDREWDEDSDGTYPPCQRRNTPIERGQDSASAP